MNKIQGFYCFQCCYCIFILLYDYSFDNIMNIKRTNTVLVDICSLFYLSPGNIVDLSNVTSPAAG